MRHFFKIKLKLTKEQKFFFAVLAVYFTFLIHAAITRADTISDIQAKITQKNQDLQSLQKEIDTYQKNLDQVSTQAASLSKDIKTLDLSKKKLDTNIKVTQTNIEKTNLNISSLSGQIKTLESKIETEKGALRETMKSMQADSDTSPIVRLLSGENISDYLETSVTVAGKVTEQTEELQTLEDQLTGKKTDAETKKKELSSLQKDLSGQKNAVLETQKEKSSLLTTTKSQEANYQKILADKKALAAQYESDIFAYQSQLHLTVDVSTLPTTVKAGVLSWPLDKITVTQLFGKTGESGRLYASGTHNGVDFAASVGTPVHATLSGVVAATGNTDLIPNCLSYGKWVLIKHPNGISSLFGHLSSIMVNVGDQVTTGQTIALSGRTGYVTGPHLHLTVLANDGYKVMAIPEAKVVNCHGAVIPLGDPSAFLDPMLYLPH